MAIDLKPGDEVITSTYTFFATAGAVARLNADGFVDIDPLTYNIDATQLATAITDRTRAIIPCTSTGKSRTWIRLWRSPGRINFM
jgi:dTDP-4-amino-4,6-dideoxygalactose transaminase